MTGPYDSERGQLETRLRSGAVPRVAGVEGREAVGAVALSRSYEGAVRMAAVQEWARGWPQDPETLPLLKDRARSDEHYDVRMAAVQELARGWPQEHATLSLAVPEGE